MPWPKAANFRPLLPCPRAFIVQPLIKSGYYLIHAPNWKHGPPRRVGIPGARHDPMDETFLTTDEVLAYLQVNLRTVYRLIKAGKIPAVRVGRQWRFRKRDLDAWLDSQRPRGASKTAPAAVSAAPVSRTTSQRPRILVVDDESSIRDLLAKTLGLADYDVETVRDGRAGLERLRLYPYDLLIVDLKMPGIDGLSLIREAKRFKSELPVIIITGYSTETAAIEAVNLGVSGYLTKPFRVPQVLAAAARAMGDHP